MIKDRLVSLINQYVGQFVENINQDNLNYSVLGGNVELKDLVLKPNALVDFLTLQLGKEQAFDVKVGHLDYIRLSIPWANLFGGTEVRLELDGLYLLLSPVSVNVANKQRVEELEQKLKQAMLRALDPSVLQKVSKEVEKHPGLFEKIGKYILNNIQIKISNVHIRYEDSISNPASPFAAGGILGGLYIFTTNDRWEEAELDSTAKILHKLGRVSDLSVYWNPRVDNSDLVGGVDLIQSGAWKTSLKKSIRSKMIKSEKFSSVLTPFTAEAKVILYNVDDYKMPKLYIQLSVDNADVRMSRNQVNNFTFSCQVDNADVTQSGKQLYIQLSVNNTDIRMSHSQYDSLTRWLEFSKLLEVNRRYRKFRPMKSVKSSPASWWKYAYKSVVEFYIKPYTWPQIVKYKQDYEKYWNLYKQYLASLKDDNIKQKLEGLEKVMDVANILKARAQAKVKYTEEMKERERLKKEEMKRKKEEKKKTGGGWFSWIWGGSEEEEELDDLATEEELFALSEEEKQEIYQGVGYSESENAQSMPKEYVAYKIQLRVRQCCGCLTRSEAPDSVCILQVVMDDMLTSYENRPGGQGVRVVSNTESFVISGISVDQKPVKMLTSNGGIYTSDLTGQMFTLEYELRPLHIKAEQSLKMTVRPVEIFYDQHSISEIFGFFQSSDHTGDTDMNALAMEKLSGVVKYSKDMLLYAMQQQSTFYVAIHMRSPYVVIPENGTLHKGGNVLVVDFGTLSVESDLQEKPDPKASMSSSPLQNQMYDKFLVKVSDVKALIADSGEDWPQFQTQVNSRFHVLPSTHLTISFYKTIVPDNYQIPHQKFDVLLPSLTLNLNDDQILVLYNFLFHFPSPSRVAWGAETARDGGELSRPRLVLADVQLDPDISTLRAIRKSILRRSVARGRLTVVEEGVPSKSALPPIQSAEDLKSMEDPSFPVMEDMDDEDGDWKSDTNIRSVEDYLTERVKMRIYLRLQIAEMVLQISQKSEGRDYLMFRLDRISADMAVLDYVQDSQTPSQCGMAAVASVGALSLADKLHTGTSGAYLELLRTESDKELITFSYRQINTKCPDFEPVFESTENKATLMCNSLTIRLDQTGTCYLKKFLQQLQDRIAENEKKRAGFPSDVIDAVPVRRRGSKDASSITSRTLSQITQRITTFVDEVDAEMGRAAVQKQTLIKFHLTSHVQKVTIHLSNLDHPVAEMELIGMDTQISVENKKACYRSQIKDLAVLDKTAGTLYPHILMLEEKDSPFFSMKVVQFWHSSKKRGKGRAGDQGLDYKVHLKIGDLQLAYVNRFLWDITKFFEPLKTPEIVEAAAATMENVSKQVAEIQPSSVRVGLVIDMKTPTVIVPKTSKSPDLLLFRFDYLQIRNSIKSEFLADESQQDWNDIRIKVKGMQISRAKVLSDKFVVSHNVAEPVDFLASVSLALEPVRSKVRYDVSGDLFLMKVNMFQSDVKLLMDIVNLNLQEGAPKSNKSGDTELSPHQIGSMEELSAPDTTDAGSAPTTPYNAVLTFQGLVVQLFEEKEEENQPLKASMLSRFEIGKLVGRINTQTSEDIRSDVNLSLQALSVDDTRPNSTVVNKRIIDCIRETINKEEEELLPLISVIYKERTNGNREADVRMEKITVHIHIPYLQSLYQFFLQALETDTPTNPSPRDSTSVDGEDIIDSPAPEPQPTGMFTLYGTMKQPEFILHGSSGPSDDRILVLEADIEFNMKNDSSEQKIGSKVKDLKMYSSRMGSKATSQHWVIQPCQVDFERSVANNHAHHQVSLAVLEVYVSPQVIRLMFDVSRMLTAEEDTKEEVEDRQEKKSFTNLWSIHQTSAQKWLDKIDPDEPNNPLLPRRAPSETLVVNVEKIDVYFRIRNLDHHVDLLHVFCSLDSTIQDWSKQLHMKADIELKASYFNERLSVWEPLIEPVCETVGVYRPWWAVIKIVKGRSYPMAFNHVQENFNMEDCLRNDVQQLLHRSLNRPSSSESETDESTEMTVLRPKLTGRASRLASERSLESLSHQASIQGESDTEPDGLIQSITNKLGGIFSDDDSSEDADISDTDDNDELFDPSLDKPVFLTPKGPMQAARDQDEVDAPLLISEQDTIEEAEPGEDVPQSYYFIMASQDQLLLNVTPQAINVLTDINKAMTEPETLEMDTINLPALQIFNKLGVNASVTLHPDVKVHSENIKDCSLYKDGENSQPCDADIVDGNGLEVQSETDEADGLISNILGRVGHVAVSAGAYVFDNDEDYLSGQNLSISRFRLHVDGFHLSSTVSHRRARRQLMPLFPHKPKEMMQDRNMHKIKYWYLLDIDVWHGRKVINFLSPLQIKNNITRSMDVFCKTKDLKVYLSVESDTEEFSKLVTIETGEVYNVPLFVAYHLELFMCPADSSYKMTRSKIWWKDLVGKEKSRTYSCPVAEADLEPFYFMVVCSKGSKLVPPQTVPAGVPYYQLTLSPPVILHNYLPYNIQYSLEGTQSAFVMLKMGDSSYLHGVDLKESYKLHLQIQDYQSIDWTGVYDITQNLEEFKAVTMAPYDFGFEGNNNKHLTLTVHATQQSVVDLYVYSPYWLVNKTDLVIQVKGSKSEAVFDCQPNRTSPVLFRFKKNRPKKAKIKVFNSRWSQSFSLDTVGNSGVVICNDRERKTKYRLMLQFQWSDLKLTRIVTITPFFLVVNKLSRALRYMEENETTDLWLDIGVGECKPYWPSTSSDKMVIEYSDSNIMSEHFPINTPHNTVLRMENGTAVCVEVSGGLETSRTISFSDYDVGDAPVQVENLCEDIFIVIRQKGQHQMTVLGQNQSILYTWDNPTGNRTLLWNVYNGKKSQESEIDITKDSYNPKRLTVKLVQSSSTYNYHDVTDGPVDSSPEDETDPGEEEEEGGDSVDGVDLRSRLKTKAYKMTIYWVSFLDRQQRVVLFTQDPRVAEAARMMYEGEHVTWFSLISLDGIALSVINEVYEEVALVSLTCLPASWEIEVKNKWKMLEDITLVTWLEDKWKNGVDQASWDNRIEVDFKNLRMTKPYIGDLRRVAYPGLFFQHRMSQHQTLIHARIYKIQIDNQLLDAYHQTVLSCAPTPAYLVKKKGPKPCIEFGMIRRVVPENNVDTFRQFQVILQELRLAVDWGFIESIQDTFADLMPTEATESAKLQSDVVVTQRPLQEVADVMVEKRPHRIFFEMFKISPVKVHVSFSLRGNPHLTRDVQPSVASDIKEFLRNSIGATFTEVKDIELKLGFFERRGALLSSVQMQTQAIAHYRQQLMLQIYVVIFGLDVLGNPYGLIKDIAEGLGELFYEPLLDTIQGEEAFSSNMVRGFQNAMGHIVGGTANSVARISGTLGNTLAYLSMDDEFQKRRVRRLQQQPRNLPHSMGMAGRGFLSGMKFGLLGVVLDPIHGASEEGVEGFFKGIGKGLLGLITQPLGGVMDMVSLAFDGLRRSAENDVVAIRMRLPRFINPYHGLEPYSWYRAQGNFILHSLRDEQHNSRVFVDFAPLSYDDRADLIFITIGTILCLSKNRFSTGYDVKWEVERERIMGIPEVMENKLVLTLKDKKGSLFSGSAIEISSPDDDILKWIQDRMERVIRQYV
ncbi:intermembrane lipid transfer protein VPS13A-like isoform X3 [Ostrea edulis]|uniref:intermembrane lipid transfer protein VPS13A-like isoform X3 n=1 Tax=Ostrea edulis TaxID=37623 RepID=UPI0024AFF0E5|nr:intermembrane lipid transfer protein VPS13A-like isoform X3 [Ostrea edulis]